LHRLYEGVWAVGYPNPPYEGAMLAAVKACGRCARLSHWSAAELWEFIEEDDRPIHVTVVGGSTRTVPGVAVHRTAALEPRDRARHRGVPVTSPARTLLDLAAVAPTVLLRQAIRTAQGRRRVHVAQLLAAIDRLGPRRGSRRLADLIATGQAPIHSVLEDVALELLLEAGFAHPDVNKPLVIAGRRVVPDFRWPDQRLILEVDGAAWHDDQLARADDAGRQAFLEAHGERVIRATWDQVVQRRSETLERVRASGAPRAPRRLLTPCDAPTNAATRSSRSTSAT
jgi:hypothetical protein